MTKEEEFSKLLVTLARHAKGIMESYKRMELLIKEIKVKDAISK